MTTLADDFNPFGGRSVQEPDAVFARARAEEPIFYSPVLASWVVTRYDDVMEVLLDPARFSSHEILSIEQLISPEVAERFAGEIPMEGTLIGLDPPAHTRLRRILHEAFTTGRVAAMAPTVEAVADQLVDGFVADGAADLVASFAYPLPLTVVLRLIGIPEAELARCASACQDWSALTVALLEGVPLEEQLRLADAIVDFHHFVLELIAERERQPADDLISALVEVRRREELTDRELLSLLPGLVLAGHETTANLVANAVSHLLADDGGAGWAALGAGTLPAADAVEEALRHDTSVVGLPRVVTRDTEVGGVPVSAGDRLYVVYWSANRDEARFPDAARFRPGRDGPPHLSFGRGIHYCIGAPLARLEARTALLTLARRLPGLRLDETFDGVRRPHFFLRALERLPVRWDAAAATAVSTAGATAAPG